MPFGSFDHASVEFSHTNIAHLHPNNPAPASYAPVGNFHPDTAFDSLPWAVNHPEYDTSVPGLLESDTYGASPGEQHPLSPAPGSSRSAPGVLGGNFDSRSVAHPQYGIFVPGVPRSDTYDALLEEQRSSYPATGSSRSVPETSSGDPTRGRHPTGIPSPRFLDPPSKGSTSGPSRPAVVQALNSTGPIRYQRAKLKKKTPRPAAPTRKKTSEGLRQGTLKKNRQYSSLPNVS